MRMCRQPAHTACLVRSCHGLSCLCLQLAQGPRTRLWHNQQVTVCIREAGGLHGGSCGVGVDCVPFLLQGAAEHSTLSPSLSATYTPDAAGIKPHLPEPQNVNSASAKSIPSSTSSGGDQRS